MKRIIITIIAAVFILISTKPVFASSWQSTSHTVTYSINEKLEISQDAYIPAGIYMDLELSSPQDLYVSNDRLYIADTGNKRIVVVDLKTNVASMIGQGILSQPTGVASDKDGKIYVADSANNAAYRFDKTGKLEFTFTKPKTPNFGKNQGYKPVKVAPSDDGGVYLISEGSLAGIIQINGRGDFLGYFASNDVEVGLFEKLVDIFLTKEQKSVFLKRTPPSLGNLFRGSNGLIYTINKGSAVKIKKHSINGLNMFKDANYLPQLDNPVDICIDDDGNMFSVDSSGFITEINGDGYFMCRFGGASKNSDRLGLFAVPSGIGTDGAGNIYVLDQERQTVQVFKMSPVQVNIHKAIDLYNNGNYEESKVLLQNILKFNDNSYLAHLYLAKNYMQQENYKKASEQFRIANAKEYYSESYWETRNIWLQQNMGYIITGIVLLALLVNILKVIRKKTKLQALEVEYRKKLLSKRVIRDLSKIKYAMVHPIDNAYDIRIDKTGSVLSASIIYVALFVLLVLHQIGSGFIFSQKIENYSIFTNLAYFIVLTGLFIVGNYFISSIDDGRGRMKDIFISIAYSFSPFIIIMPFVILFSNVATINEKFFIDTTILVLLVWSIINVILSLIEIHEYSFKKTIKSILLTLFFMAVAILAFSVWYLLLKQMVDFVVQIVKEVILRG
ncbi:MAG: YIP1 family protein [Clostridiales bacterium]|nr:YIP1 family protein [Clostridiales bacterium]HBM79748.1 hypothetical protein [Clostridiaceae bacterium]